MPVEGDENEDVECRIENLPTLPMTETEEGISMWMEDMDVCREEGMAAQRFALCCTCLEGDLLGIAASERTGKRCNGK